MNYYCFVAGAKDLLLDTTKGAPSMEGLLEEYEDILSKGDAKLLRLLRLSYDNDNFLLLIDNKDISINTVGNINLLTWMEAMPNMLEEDPKAIYKQYGIEEYFTKFYQEIKSENTSIKPETYKNYLFSLYYEHAMKTNSKFLRQWFEYNMNMNNVITALVCKKHGFDVNKHLMTGSEIAETILSNYNSKDLGLSGVYDDIDMLNTIYENRYLIDQERRYDALKWEWLDTNTFFHPFSIEMLLAYWLKCELMHRWDKLTIDEGAKVFEEILHHLKKDIQF